jgi:hypothetical protein
LARPHDAPRRNAGKLLGTLEFDGECASIRADRATHDLPVKLIASMASGILPGPVVGHRSFNGKESLIVIGNDEEERRGLFGHPAT